VQIIFLKNLFYAEYAVQDNRIVLDKSENVTHCIMKRKTIQMPLSIRLSSDERILAESYAIMHSISLADTFKQALFEKIEDEYDITIANRAYQKCIADGKKNRPLSELKKELADLILKEKSMSFQTDSLHGVLKSDYDEKSMREERISSRKDMDLYREIFNTRAECVIHPASSVFITCNYFREFI